MIYERGFNSMSNYYDDSFVYAIDSKYQKHLVAQCSSASLGGAYRDEVCINGKTYSVFYGVDDTGMDTEITGSFLPYVELIDCRSFFTEQPTAPMKQAIGEAGLENANIVKLIWLHFESNAWNIITSTGWVITPNGESCVDYWSFDKAIAKTKDIDLIADDVVTQVM